MNRHSQCIGNERIPLPAIRIVMGSIVKFHGGYDAGHLPETRTSHI
jgi:hypothetical protein